ncbi:hypothetical protein FSP39_012957 [Pinctada imbricata]|uniref:BPTI/Kunitz inhibitor domain-containing protein n=1 Tax=Pinctada imbricata TaxID=66713 RepID=A0AA88YJP7_PINIB|nr:hypothetical protein FSP39_012957 [Pinctada imbricata]
MNMSFPVCVPRTYVEVKMRVCELPPQPGDCGARFIRWFYNKHSNKCSWFYFQGCRGNQNNFKSKSECEQMCIPERQFDNKANHKKPYVLAATSPRIVSKPFYLEEPERTSNQIIRPYYLRAKKVTEEEKELRRKRRLERRRMKRLRKLRRRRRRKGLKGKKKRREGKVKGRKKRNKNKKDRKNRRKNKKNRKKRRRKKKKNRDDTTTLNPQVGVNSSTKSNSRAHEITDDINIVSIIDKTTDTLKSNIEKIKSGDNKLKKEKPVV